MTESTQTCSDHSLPHLWSLGPLRFPVGFCCSRHGKHTPHTPIYQVRACLLVIDRHVEVESTAIISGSRSMVSAHRHCWDGLEETRSSRTIWSASSSITTHTCHRTAYFFLQHSPLQFQVCAVFQLSVDFGMFKVSEVT